MKLSRRTADGSGVNDGPEVFQLSDLHHLSCLTGDLRTSTLAAVRIVESGSRIVKIIV